MRCSVFVRLLAAVLAALAPAGAAWAFFIDLHPSRTVLEYYNEHTGHYVLLSDPAEIAGVDGGAAGPGWKRTGYSFGARNESQAASNVCRFYAPSANSHFFTADPVECAYLRTHDTGWIYEKLDFAVDLPVDGACAGAVAVYRLYNNRWMFADSNHRFTPDGATRDDMKASGWRDEGVAFCATFAARKPLASFSVATRIIRPSAECENEALNLGPCIALNQIARLQNEIVSWAPPWYVTRGPYYSPAFSQLTGHDGDVHTAQPVNDANGAAQRSFVQTLFASSDFGIHVSSLDRTLGKLASINPLYQFATAAPAGGAPDARIFPWRFGRQNDLEVSFNLRVRMARHAGPEGQAYGHPTLQFMDTRSGRHLYVTLGTYGTGVSGAPADLVMVDSSTQRVIVGTSFRAHPRFGKRLAGDFLPCDGVATAGTCAQPAADAFAFRIGRDDFREVLALARALNPQLSATPEDYILANFHFNNEVHMAAELGLALRNFKLELFGY